MSGHRQLCSMCWAPSFGTRCPLQSRFLTEMCTVKSCNAFSCVHAMVPRATVACLLATQKRLRDLQRRHMCAEHDNAYSEIVAPPVRVHVSHKHSNARVCPHVQPWALQQTLSEKSRQCHAACFFALKNSYMYIPETLRVSFPCCRWRMHLITTDLRCHHECEWSLVVIYIRLGPA